MKKLFSTIAIMALIMITFTIPALACEGPDCADNVYSHVDGGFNAYDSDNLYKDNGQQGASAFADGNAGGGFSASSYGDKVAWSSAPEVLNKGAVDPDVFATHNANGVLVGAKSTSGSIANAFAGNDGGVRDASVFVNGNVYQSNGAYTTDGPGNFASGGNSSGAAYSNDDESSYEGSKHTEIIYVGGHSWGILNPKNYDKVTTYTCEPGVIAAGTAGAATTQGGTLVYSNNGGNSAVSFGITGNSAIGNNGVWGNGGMETGTSVSDGNSYAGTYTEGNFNYSGNGYGAGASLGGGVSHIGDGTASAGAFHMSTSTGNNGGGRD